MGPPAAYRFHVIAVANEAMDTVRRDEMRDQPRVVRAAMGTRRKALKGMFWGMRKDHSDWNIDQFNTMYRLQRSNLKSARAWRLKEGLRATQPARTIQEARHYAQRSPGRRRARHARPVKQCLCRGDEWHAPANQARRARVSNRKELRRHRLPSDVQVAEPAAESHASSCAAPGYHLQGRPSISTVNGKEPLFLGGYSRSEKLLCMIDGEVLSVSLLSQAGVPVRMVAGE